MVRERKGRRNVVKSLILKMRVVPTVLLVDLLGVLSASTVSLVELVISEKERKENCLGGGRPNRLPLRILDKSI